MQIMPDTAKLLAKRHRIPYKGSKTLVQPAENIQMGTAYLRDLLDRFEENPVLATGAYNAGPGAVDRWLKDKSTDDPAIWIETLPYFETRDYIPRVLAFSTLYDWRRQQPIKRISARMPALKSGNMGSSSQKSETAEVVCLASG
jgi:soluble lytic murein transglycosylase